MMAKPAFFGVVQVYIANGLGVLACSSATTSSCTAPIFTFAAFVPLRRRAGGWCGRYVHRPFHYDRAIMRHLVRGGIPLMALTVINLIYGTIDIPILGSITDNIAGRLVPAGLQWVGIPIFITTAVVTCVLPAVLGARQPMTAEFPPLVNQAVRIVLLAAVPCSIGLAWSPTTSSRLVYEPEY